MIRYAIACEGQHVFESWFPSSDAFDDLVARKLVTCPVCDSHKVAKSLMAPAIARSERAAAPVPASASSEPQQAVSVMGERERQLRAMLRAVREHVTSTAEHVGERFPEEARAIHDGAVPARAIYGEADAGAVRALVEDGIAVMPLPALPDDLN